MKKNSILEMARHFQKEAPLIAQYVSNRPAFRFVRPLYFPGVDTATNINWLTGKGINLSDHFKQMFGAFDDEPTGPETLVLCEFEAGADEGHILNIMGVPIRVKIGHLVWAIQSACFDTKIHHLCFVQSKFGLQAVLIKIPKIGKYEIECHDPNERNVWKKPIRIFCSNRFQPL